MTLLLVVALFSFAAGYLTHRSRKEPDPIDVLARKDRICLNVTPQARHLPSHHSGRSQA